MRVYVFSDSASIIAESCNVVTPVAIDLGAVNRFLHFVDANVVSKKTKKSLMEKLNHFSLFRKIKRDNYFLRGSGTRVPDLN